MDVCRIRHESLDRLRPVSHDAPEDAFFFFTALIRIFSFLAFCALGFPRLDSGRTTSTKLKTVLEHSPGVVLWHVRDSAGSEKQGELIFLCFLEAD